VRKEGGGGVGCFGLRMLRVVNGGMKTKTETETETVVKVEIEMDEMR